MPTEREWVDPDIGYTAAEIAAVTRVVRTADQAFTNSGGSSRHWVRECFLPALQDAGLRIVSVVDEGSKGDGQA